MKSPKQSMRQVRDAATIERAAEVIRKAAESPLVKVVPGNTPRFYRGALIKPK